MSDKIAEIQARRAARKAELAAARDAQYAADLEALDALEVEHGDGCVASLETDHYVKGLPTLAVLRTPTGAEYKRFAAMVNQAKDDATKRLAALDLLARSVWLYPAKEQQPAMLEAFPGLLLAIAARAAQLVEAKAADEKNA